MYPTPYPTDIQDMYAPTPYPTETYSIVNPTVAPLEYDDDDHEHDNDAVIIGSLIGAFLGVLSGLLLAVSYWRYHKKSLKFRSAEVLEMEIISPPVSMELVYPESTP